MVYRELIADFHRLRAEEPTVEDPAERDRFRRLVEREARLLDRLYLTGWMASYADECFYWVPTRQTEAIRAAKLR